MSRGLKHMLNRELSRGWLAWIYMREAALARMASMRHGMGHMLNRELSRGWLSWCELVSSRFEFLELLRRGLFFIVNRQLAACYYTWIGQLEFARRHERGLGALRLEVLARELDHFGRGQPPRRGVRVAVLEQL